MSKINGVREGETSILPLVDRLVLVAVKGGHLKLEDAIAKASPDATTRVRLAERVRTALSGAQLRASDALQSFVDEKKLSSALANNSGGSFSLN